MCLACSMNPVYFRGTMAATAAHDSPYDFPFSIRSSRLSDEIPRLGTFDYEAYRDCVTCCVMLGQNYT